MSLVPRRDRSSAVVLSIVAGLVGGALAVLEPQYLGAIVAALALGYLFLRTKARTEMIVAIYWAAFALLSTMLMQWVVPGIFIVFYLAMLVGILAGSMAGGLRLEPTITWLYAAFLLLVVVSLIGSYASMGTLVDRLILFPFGALVLLQFRSATGYRSVTWTAVLTSLAIAIWVVVRADQADFAYRANLDIDQNIVSFYIGLGAVLMLAWFLYGGRRPAQRWTMLFGALALGLMIYSQFLLASRGAVIALGATLLVLAVRTALRNPRRLLLLLGVLLVAGASLLLPGSAGVLERFERDSTLTGGGRTAIWSAIGTEMLRAEPLELLIGHGFDASSTFVSNNFGTLDSTHNAYLLIAFDFGFLGLALFLAMHMVSLYRAWRDSSLRGAMAVALVTFLLITNLTLSTPYNFLYWAALGTALAMTSNPSPPASRLSMPRE